MKRSASAIILAILFLFLVPACAQQVPAAEKTQITLLHGWSGNTVDCVAMREIFDSFNAENPDVQLNCMALPGGDAVIEKAEEMYAVGKVPDIISTSGCGGSAFYNYIITNGYALDLMPYIREDTDFAEDLSALNQDSWSTGDGRLFTISDVLMMSGYWYNVDLFQEAGIQSPPATWEEFEEACQKLNHLRSDGSVRALEANSDSMSDLFDAFLVSQSNEAETLLKKYSQTGFDFQSELIVTGLENFRKLCKSSGIRISGTYFVDALSNFNSGRSALLLGGVWSNVSISKDINARFATFPGTGGKTVSCVSAGINYILGNSGDRAKEDACIRFIKYMLRDDIQEKLAVITGQMPSNPTISLEDYRESIPALVEAVRIANSADVHIERSAIQWRNDEDAQTYFQDCLPDFLSGSITAQEFSDLLSQR